MRARFLTGALFLVVTLLAGCTATSAQPSFVHLAATRRSPSISSVAAPSIRWVTGSRDRVLLTMQGGVSCPRIPVEIEVESPVKVILTMKTYRGVCTTDSGPETSEFSLPPGVSRHEAVSFTMTTAGPEPSQTALLRAPTS